MAIHGIAGGILSILTNSQNQKSPFQQIGSEFQQLAQDLQAGNLSQAQTDFTTLSQNLPGLNQVATTPDTANSNPVAQAFTQLGKDLQSGNLQGAEQDFTALLQDAQQAAPQVEGHRHHHHAQSPQSSSSNPQSNPIVQAFSTLAQDLQAGNLSGAQSAFATLQNDLQQIGGLAAQGGSSAAAAIPTSGLNVLV